MTKALTPRSYTYTSQKYSFGAIFESNQLLQTYSKQYTVISASYDWFPLRNQLHLTSCSWMYPWFMLFCTSGISLFRCNSVTFQDLMGTRDVMYLPSHLMERVYLHLTNIFLSRLHPSVTIALLGLSNLKWRVKLWAVLPWDIKDAVQNRPKNVIWLAYIPAAEAGKCNWSLGQPREELLLSCHDSWLKCKAALLRMQSSGKCMAYRRSGTTLIVWHILLGLCSCVKLMHRF